MFQSSRARFDSYNFKRKQSFHHGEKPALYWLRYKIKEKQRTLISICNLSGHDRRRRSPKRRARKRGGHRSRTGASPKSKHRGNSMIHLDQFQFTVFCRARQPCIGKVFERRSGAALTYCFLTFGGIWKRANVQTDGACARMQMDDVRWWQRQAVSWFGGVGRRRRNDSLHRKYH